MIKKRLFKITGMHCTSCAFNIDGELEDMEGIVESSTNYAKSVTEVKFDEGKVDESRIISVIKNVGYEVEAI